MKSRMIPLIVFAVVFLAAPLRMALSAQQDRFSNKALDGISFSEFQGYDAWQTVAVSRTANDIKAILGNPAMIAAYKSGIPGNGQPFPDGVQIVKIEWKQAPNPLSPYAVEIPNTLDAVAFIEKDSKRFPDSSG